MERGVPDTSTTTHMTMDQVAEALGISKTTVSRAISGKGRVGKATRLRVLDYLAREGATVEARTGYAAQHLPTGNIALVAPDVFVSYDVPFFRKSLLGICHVAQLRRLDVVLCLVGDTQASQLRRQIEEHKVDGVILMRTTKNDPCVAAVEECGIPSVLIGHSDATLIPQVDHDQEASAFEMTQTLQQMGMRRITYVTNDLDNMANSDRLGGYERAMRSAGLRPDVELVYSFQGMRGWREENDVARAVMAHNPECILCCDDMVASALITLLRELDIAVPDQVRLASLYDSELTQRSVPSITSVSLDALELGALACRSLLDLFDGKQLSQRNVLEYQIILRESTKML